MNAEITMYPAEFLFLQSTDYFSDTQAHDFEVRQLRMMIEGGEYDIRKTQRYLRLHFSGLSHERIYSLYRHVDRTKQRVDLLKKRAGGGSAIPSVALNAIGMSRWFFAPVFVYLFTRG